MWHCEDSICVVLTAQRSWASMNGDGVLVEEHVACCGLPQFEVGEGTLFLMRQQ
jgi:hypothetical protein